MKLADEMREGAIMLDPGKQLTGTFKLDLKTFPAGRCRIETVFYGWNDRVSDADRADLARIGVPFMRGEIPASTMITLTP